MKRNFNLFAVKTLSLLVAIFVTSLAVNAAASSDVNNPKGVSDKNFSIAVRNLTEKLKTDLANDNVAVNLTTIKQYQIAKNQVGLKGEGFCILTDDNNKLPIQFDVQIDNAKNAVIDVKYDFPELVAESEFAPATTEEILMQELMKQISSDYKTTNIVVSIDNFEKTAASTDQNEFNGQGEVRIGDFEWKKIDFQIQLKETSAEKVKYQLR